MSTRLWRRRRPARDFADEIDAHLDLEVRTLVDEGLAPEEARLAARRRFGSVTSAQERFYEAGRLLWLDHLVQDLRDALRSLIRYPVACGVAIVSLAGGIGATTATLTVRDVVFRRPPPLYREPARLSRVQVGSLERPILPFGSEVPGPLFALWRDAQLTSALAAATPETMHDIRVGARTESARVRRVTPDFFSVLGVAPALGQTFPPDADARAAPVVLSYRIWRDLLDGRGDAPGSTIWIDSQPFVVAGVMPEPFWFSTWTRSCGRGSHPTPPHPNQRSRSSRGGPLT